MKRIALFITTITCLGFQVSAQEKTEPSTQKPAQVADPNKDAYHRASRAASAKTFEGAKLLISQIDLKAITDPDVASYVDLSSRFAAFCAELGIPRDAGTDYMGVIKNFNYPAILKALTSKGIAGAPAKATELVSEGFQLKKQMPIYNELDSTLRKRYGAP